MLSWNKRCISSCHKRRQVLPWARSRPHDSKKGTIARGGCSSGQAVRADGLVSTRRVRARCWSNTTAAGRPPFDLLTDVDFTTIVGGHEGLKRYRAPASPEVKPGPRGVQLHPQGKDLPLLLPAGRTCATWGPPSWRGCMPDGFGSIPGSRFRRHVHAGRRAGLGLAAFGGGGRLAAQNRVLVGCGGACRPVGHRRMPEAAAATPPSSTASAT